MQNETLGRVGTLLRSLEPTLHEGVYVFASQAPTEPVPDVELVGTFREEEGLTLILEEPAALRAGLPILFRAAWISLTVHSALEAVGLTAAFATALTEHGISCNVVAGAFHDHLFVPVDRAEDAMECLRALQKEAGG